VAGIAALVGGGVSFLADCLKEADMTIQWRVARNIQVTSHCLKRLVIKFDRLTKLRDREMRNLRSSLELIIYREK
jgi:hypothetical protein